MSLIGPGKGLIVDLSCSLQPLSPTIDQPLQNTAVTDDDYDNDDDDAWHQWTDTAN